MPTITPTPSPNNIPIGTVRLTAPKAGLLCLPGITPASAKAVSDCLTENHNTHHIFFNTDGFHNHISHYLLALYDLGGSAELITQSYHHETVYQRTLSAVPHPSIDPLDPQYLGLHTSYQSYLSHFRSEISTKGYEKVLQETFFNGTERSEDMLVRLFSGFLHPFIHIGYGIEFRQPAIVAEGLALAATSAAWLGDVLRGAEKKEEEMEEKEKEKGKGRSLVELMEEIRGNEKLRNAPRYTDVNKIKAVYERAPEELLGVLAKYKVGEDELEFRMAENINAAALFTAASQRKDKEIRLDFFHMHSHNSSLFLPTFLSLPFLTTPQKARFLTWKSRHDLTLYISRRSPDLYPLEIQHYIPKNPSTNTNPWLNLLDRAMRWTEDDGHLVKFIRAAMVGERVCAPYEGGEWRERGLLVHGDMWVRMAHMAVDAMENPTSDGGSIWVRNTGFEEAWERFGMRRDYEVERKRAEEEEVRRRLEGMGVAN
ncbi:hypothetical protein BZA77DRAFT_359922 [Pyronema omphalodes]|nr:hypothetical protein BZA77DRAFT_359922 [Pyronema omphalodes]